LKKSGAGYTDFTRKFSTRSAEGNMSVFIMYDWSSNAILPVPVPNTKSNTIISTFKTNILYLKGRGFKPHFNIIDNVASKAVQEYQANEETIKIQLVEPYSHHVNVAEWKIQTFKSHLIVGLCTTSTGFSALLWDYLIPQAQYSINMLQTLRVHPKVSDDHILEGVHDFNQSPWPPPTTRATIFIPPEIRSSWEGHTIDACYVGPAPKYYRCYKFYVPATGKTRIAGQATFYPEHCEVPTETPMYKAK
jgi:hypothetical protein